MKLSYEKIVEKIEKEETITSSDITAEQLFMLFHDRYIKTIEYGHALYEFNLIPIEDTENKYKYWDYDKIDCISLMQAMIETLIKNKSVYILVQDEPFQVKLEVLETKQ